MSSQFNLMREQRFRPLFFTQFLGAFNDNVFKTALITLVTFRAGQLTTLDPKMLATLLPGLFILPFFLFSATSGQLADKLEKSRIARAVKVFEIGIMLLAGWGFLTNSLWQLVAALFLMGLHSTLFGPVKYAYLPQHLKPSELTGGNGLIEMGTFVAILLGEVLGVLLATLPQHGLYTSVTVVGLALLGWAASRGIPLTPAVDPQLKVDWNPVTATWETLRFARSNRTVWLSLLGISWFWFYGATLLAQFPTYAKENLGGDESVFILLLALFSVGIGVGSLLCEKLSGDKVEIGLVPFGAIGLTLFGVDLYFASPDAASTAGRHFTAFLAERANWRLLVDIVLLGLFGGFYIVPLYALIQTRSEKSRQSRVIAANNVMNAFFMVISALVSMLLFALGLSIPQLFLATALFNAVVALYIYSLVPEFLMRFMVWLLIHSVYRLKKSGLERIPEEGPALLVCNHVSYVDALVISAACRRPVRWVMDRRIFEIPLLSFFFRTVRAIPIAPAKEDPAALERAYEAIAEALAAGELVGLFPEGKLTSDGEMAPFRPGILRVLERTPVPVVPMALSGLWQSLFARNRDKLRYAGKLFSKKIGLAVGEPMDPRAATIEALHATVLVLRGESK
jgi:1-acyl-sn-glycerol-3-phosphate acyltransferase